jgi:hypothetical protein
MTFILNPLVLEEIAHGPEMVHVLGERAETAAALAQATAPVGSGDDPHPGQFRDSIKAASGTDIRGAYGRVLTDDPAGAYIEFGTSDTPAHATIRRAVEATVGPLKGHE